MKEISSHAKWERDVILSASCVCLCQSVTQWLHVIACHEDEEFPASLSQKESSVTSGEKEKEQERRKTDERDV